MFSSRRVFSTRLLSFLAPGRRWSGPEYQPLDQLGKRGTFEVVEGDELGGLGAELDDSLGGIEVDDVDTGAQLLAGEDIEFLEEDANRVRDKIDWHILPLMCTLYWIQFMDKTTLGSSAILGIREATHLTTNEYNMLGTIFYVSYLLFEYPQNLALQRFPVGKWMSLNIFVWGLALLGHAACKNFAGLFAVRFILGMCEGSITAGFMIVSSMFYTRNEQTLRVGYWFLMNGTAQIISGFISFGTLHIKTEGFEPWQWYRDRRTVTHGDVHGTLSDINMMIYPTESLSSSSLRCACPSAAMASGV